MTKQCHSSQFLFLQILSHLSEGRQTLDNSLTICQMIDVENRKINTQKTKFSRKYISQLKGRRKEVSTL